MGAPPDAAARDDAAVAVFIERFANQLVDAGIARMPARVFAALLAEDTGRLTAADLADKLQASPAAISGAVRYLIQVGLAAREREPGTRRDVYVVHEDPWYDAILNRDKILSRWESTLTEGLTAVGTDTGAGLRLRETIAFFAFVRDEMPAMMRRWEQLRDERFPRP